MTIFATREPCEILTIRPIDKGKSQFQPVTIQVLPSAKVTSSLSSIYVPREKSPVTTYYIIPKVDIVGTKFREFMFGGLDKYKKLAWECVDMDKTWHNYVQVTGKIFIMNC